MATLPSFPTDSLYKFVAIFGLVLVAFSTWYPDEKFAASYAKLQDTIKEQDLSRIRVERKKARVDRIVGEIQKKLADLAAKEKPLIDELARLGEKRTELQKEAALLQESHASKAQTAETKARVDELNAELHVLAAKTKEHKDEVRQLTEESHGVHSQQEEVLDELKAETVSQKAINSKIQTELQEERLWFVLSIVFTLGGLVMIVIGFRLWYTRVQIFQDAILRRQAAAREEPSS